MTVPTDRRGGGEVPRIDPRIRQRRASIARRQGRRRLRWLVVAMGAVALVVGATVLLHSPLFEARVVAVVGSHPHTPTSAIVEAAGLASRPPLIDVDPGRAAGLVEELPYVGTAKVSRHWPDGVTVAVTERVPVAAVAGPGSSWSVVDGTGRTLQVEAARPAGLVVLTVSGSKGAVAPAPPGQSLPPSAAAGVRVAATLPRAFSAQVTSVAVATDGTVDLTLGSGLSVLLGTDADLRAKYEDIAAIIAHATLRGAKTIDVTVPESPTVSDS